MTDERPYSPGLEGVIAAETALGYVDGERGRLLYRGYRIGDLVERGTFPAVANLLWTGEWDRSQRMATLPVPPAVLAALDEPVREIGQKRVGRLSKSQLANLLQLLDRIREEVS